jgi:replicative DNA helicase
VDRVFDFSESAQVQVLNLLFAAKLSPSVIEATYFHNPILSEICESILTLQRSYTLVTESMLETHLLRKPFFKEQEYRTELAEILPNIFVVMPKHEQQFIMDLALQFARLQAWHRRLREGQDIWHTQNGTTVEQLDALFATPLTTGKPVEIGTFYFSSLRDRLQARQRVADVLHSFIPGLDMSLKGGGFARQTLTTFLALTKTGKSFALGHMAMAAVIQKKNTVLYSLEMSESEITERFDAMLSGTRTYDLREHGHVVARAVELHQHLFGDVLLITPLRAGQGKVSEIRAHLTLAGQAGFIPEVIVLDHMNLMDADALSREGRQQDLGAIYVGMKGVSQEWNGWVFTGAQANRLGYHVELITEEHMAHTFQGAHNSDYVISINRTKEEDDREKARLYKALDRHGRGRQVIEIDTMYAKGAFFTRKAKA